MFGILFKLITERLHISIIKIIIINNGDMSCHILVLLLKLHISHALKSDKSTTVMSDYKDSQHLMRLELLAPSII